MGSRARSAAVLACAAALVGSVAGPAGAAPGSGSTSATARAEVPWYQFTGIGPTWHCGPTDDHGLYHQQICTIVNGRNYQGALIFVSDYSDSYAATVQNIQSRAYGQFRICRGEIPAGKRVVCFAPTETGTAGHAVQGYASDPNFYDLFGPSITLR